MDTEAEQVTAGPSWLVRAVRSKVLAQPGGVREVRPGGRGAAKLGEEGYSVSSEAGGTAETRQG